VRKEIRDGGAPAAAAAAGGRRRPAGGTRLSVSVRGRGRRAG
jgi:hypothetical protein